MKQFYQIEISNNMFDQIFDSGKTEAYLTVKQKAEVGDALDLIAPPTDSDNGWFHRETALVKDVMPLNDGKYRLTLKTVFELSEIDPSLIKDTSLLDNLLN